MIEIGRHRRPVCPSRQYRGAGTRREARIE